MIVYDEVVFISYKLITNLGVELIIATYNKDTRETLHVMQFISHQKCKPIILFLF